MNEGEHTGGRGTHQGGNGHDPEQSVDPVRDF